MKIADLILAEAAKIQQESYQLDTSYSNEFSKEDLQIIQKNVIKLRPKRTHLLDLQRGDKIIGYQLKKFAKWHYFFPEELLDNYVENIYYIFTNFGHWRHGTVQLGLKKLNGYSGYTNFSDPYEDLHFAVIS